MVAVVLALASVTAAVRLGARDSPDLPVSPTAAFLASPSGPQPFVPSSLHEWSGHVLAGAAYDAPAHLRETEALVAPVWWSGVRFRVTAPPESMEVALEWTGVEGSRIQLVAQKGTADGRVVEYATAFSGERLQCMRLQPPDPLPGDWTLMVVSLVAVSVDFAIRVRLAGGSGALVLDEAHGRAADDALPGGAEAREPLACA